MTRSVILTAGLATRAGHLAPAGCKALIRLADEPVIERQLRVLPPDPVIVCRSEHARMLEQYGEVVVNDAGRGAADALLSALHVVSGPVVVAYADTDFTDLPDGSDWVGVWTAAGGRSWDVVRDGYVTYEHVAEGWTAKVAVGLYAFSDTERVRRIADRLIARHIMSTPEIGLAPILNVYSPWREVEVPSWLDTGDPEALARAERELRT